MRDKTAILTLPLLLALVLAGCGKDDNSGEPGDESTASGAQADQPAAEGKKKKAKKDRGEASMTLGSVDWTAERAEAELKDNRLIIKASRMDMVDNKVSRQELHLRVDDYKGPGDYTTGLTGSRFIGVGFDVAEAKEAAKADEAAKDDGASKKVATKALAGAEHMMLSKANVTIESANDQEVTGSFSWKPQYGNDPAISKGSFRALIEN